MKPELNLVKVDKYIEEFKRFIDDISACTSNIDQIIKSEKKGLLSYSIDLFMRHYVFLVYSYCTINCYKIFKESEDWSILKLCNKIENSHFDKELKELIESNEKEIDSISIKSKADFIRLASEIRADINEKSTILEKINNRRLKFYAHLDKDYSNFEPENLKDLKVVKDLAIKVFHKIKGGLHGTQFMLEKNLVSIGPILNDIKYADECRQKNKDDLAKNS